jgi:hypothetical protein
VNTTNTKSNVIRLDDRQERSPLLGKWILLQSVVCDPQYSPTELRVFARLLDHHNTKTGQCNPRASTIAKALGLKRPAVALAITKLRATGRITIRNGRRCASNFGFPGLGQDPTPAVGESAVKESANANTLPIKESANANSRSPQTRTQGVRKREHKNSRKNSVKETKDLSLACASDFTPACASVEPTYESPDKAVHFTALEIDDLLRDLPALREMSVIGMLKHTDEIFVLKGYRPAERKLALGARLRKLHMDATASGEAAKALGVHHSTVQADLGGKSAKNGGKSATPAERREAAIKPKPKKRVWGDDFM